MVESAPLPDAVKKRPLLALFFRYKQRLAFLVLIAGLLVIAREIESAYPRDVAVVFELGPDHRRVDELRISYLLGDEPVAGATFRALAEDIDHEVTLSPGRYTVRAELDRGDETERVERSLTVPAEGRVHIRLYRGDLS